MAFQWSEQQLKAIHTTGHPVLVSASAGAGKTTVLVARLMKRMLEDQISVDRIAAMTFTEAAASEMKKRLLQSLNDKLREDLSESQRQFCRQQLLLLPSAHISTIHSFCLSIIQADYALIGLNPARLNTIFDDAALSAMKEEAFDAALTQSKAEQGEALPELLQFFSARSEDFSELKKAVFAIAARAGGSHDPEQWLQRCLEAGQPIQRLQQLPAAIRDAFFARCETMVQRLEDIARQMVSLALLQNEEGAQALPLLDLLIRKLQPALEAARMQDYSDFRRALFNAISSKTVNIKNADAYNALRKQLMTLGKQSAAALYSEQTLLDDQAALYPILCTLCDLTRRYRNEFDLRKQQQEGIDFDDMEHLAWQILQADGGSVARRYQEQFDEIMVDEFQDTNELQNAILTAVSRGNNLFRVGDVKQSIYRFRGARSQIMRGLMNDTEDNVFVHLSSNYRSKQTIVDFNNALFMKLMNIPGCNDRYTEYDCVQTGAPAQRLNNEAVEFHALMIPDLKSDDDQENLTSNLIKARYIAQRILTMHEQSAWRQWKDYVVLVRSHAVKIHLKQAFDEAGIPCYIDTRAGFVQSEAIQILLSWFNILLNPADSLALTAVLTSPYYHTTDEQLAQMALRRQRRPLIEVLRDSGHPLCEDLQHLRQVVSEEGLCALISELLRLHDFYELHCTSQQRTNCDLLLQKAEIFSRDQSDSLAAFAAMLDRMSEEKTSEAIPVGSEDDVVKVMTIHQSKGLQFPVVLYWANSRIDLPDQRETCVTDADLGIGLMALDMPWRLRRPSLIRQAIEYRFTLEELEENVRILYVALTRAQEKMILVDTVKQEPAAQPVTLNTLMQRRGTTDLILSAMTDCRADFWKLVLVSRQEEPRQVVKPERDVVTIAHYQGIDRPWQTLSPSAEEDQLPLPPLAPNRLAGRHTQRGILLHEAVEQLPQTPWTFAMLKAQLPTLSEPDIQRLLQLDRQPLFRRCQAMTVKKELPFALELDRQLIRGQIDYLAWDQQEMILIDFKSDRISDPQTLMDHYRPQLQLYVRCLKEMAPQHALSAYLYSFEMNRFLALSDFDAEAESDG